MPRVVSLIASATEIVCALGFEDQLVGRSHECDFPDSVRRLPVCTEPKFDVEGSSYAIDQRVKAVLQEGLSVYRVHADLLRQLGPDVIVTQSHCEVCAVSQRDVERAVCDWMGARPKVVSLAPNALADVWDSVRQVAAALGADRRGEELVRTLQQRMTAIAERARSLPDRPTVAFVEWIDPLMAGGNWVPELIEMAGGVNLFGEAGKHSPWMTWDGLRGRDPDVIFVAPCGFDLARTRREMTALTGRPDWQEMRAVRDGRVYLADGNRYFNRPGPRLVESLEILAEVLHPEAFAFGHDEKGWCNWGALERIYVGVWRRVIVDFLGRDPAELNALVEWWQGGLADEDSLFYHEPPEYYVAPDVVSALLPAETPKSLDWMRLSWAIYPIIGRYQREHGLAPTCFDKLRRELEDTITNWLASHQPK